MQKNKSQPMGMKINFRLLVKDSTKEIATVIGRKMEEEEITVRDMQKAIEVEQYLERIFGYRFHIDMLP